MTPPVRLVVKQLVGWLMFCHSVIMALKGREVTLSRFYFRYQPWIISHLRRRIGSPKLQIKDQAIWTPSKVWSLRLYSRFGHIDSIEGLVTQTLFKIKPYSLHRRFGHLDSIQDQAIQTPKVWPLRLYSRWFGLSSRLGHAESLLMIMSHVDSIQVINDKRSNYLYPMLGYIDHTFIGGWLSLTPSSTQSPSKVTFVTQTLSKIR